MVLPMRSSAASVPNFWLNSGTFMGAPLSDDRINTPSPTQDQLLFRVRVRSPLLDYTSRLRRKVRAQQWRQRREAFRASGPGANQERLKRAASIARRYRRLRDARRLRSRLQAGARYR